jgi:hypothetical protein
MSHWLQRAPNPHGVSPTDGVPQAGGQSNRQSLTGRHGLLPALRVKIGAAQGAAGGVWRDALAAFGAVARVHRNKDAVTNVRTLITASGAPKK